MLMNKANELVAFSGDYSIAYPNWKATFLINLNYFMKWSYIWDSNI